MARGDTSTLPSGGGTPTPVTAEPVAKIGPAAATAAKTATVSPPAGNRKRRILVAVLLLVLGLAVWKGWSWWVEGRFLISTDDAYLKAETATIAARTTGAIVATPIGDGEAVKAGDVLVEIDPVDARLSVDAAEAKIATQEATVARIAAQIEAQRASVAQAEAQLVAARADAERAMSEFDRATALVKVAAGTQQKLDQARADRDRTQAAVASAEAGVAAARGARLVFEAQKREAEQGAAELAVALDKARRDLGFTRVVAPFDGVVGNRAAQTGALVQPGTRLLALVPLDRVYVEANFKETQLKRIRPGQTARIEVDALGGEVIEGRVVGLSPATGAQFSLLPPENATGNFTKIVQRVPVRIEVTGAAARRGLLRAGLSVTAEVDTRTGPEDGAR